MNDAVKDMVLNMSMLEFWYDINKTSAMMAIESMFIADIRNEYTITDMFLSEGKVVLKWSKRMPPIS